ncbi:MAG: hypothetical protein K1X51_03100 [Rhodospirillaceae bacterium]|nr:hypothetical protein [Rhodospirillaceae bacterium]
MTLSKMLLSATALCAALAFGTAQAAEGESIIKDRRIGYVTTDLHWTMYQTADGKAECPRGLSPNGPREIYKALFPNLGPVESTQLAREALKMYPRDMGGNKFEYIEVAGNIAEGLNLDGKVGPKDFTSPLGEKGIDNAFYRVTGCNSQFRGPEGQLQLFANKQIPDFGYNRILLEITDVDDLANDPDVTVTVSRGRDPLLLDATGEKVAPGGTQRVDATYGAKVIQKFKGRIKDGVLTTEAHDGTWPWQIFGGVPRSLLVRDMRFSMKLTPRGADGLIAGYFDNESLYRWLTSWSTHHLSYGQLEAGEFYWEILKNADGHPGKDGQMTAISSAITLNMAQVYIEHPQKAVASIAAPTKADTAQGARH